MQFSHTLIRVDCFFLGAWPVRFVRGPARACAVSRCFAVDSADETVLAVLAAERCGCVVVSGVGHRCEGVPRCPVGPRSEAGAVPLRD